jgi:tetratricopeptide (TPR) repeat protein
VDSIQSNHQSAAARLQTPKKIEVFIASPGDLAPEREAFRDVCLTLNSGFGTESGVVFEPTGWEALLSSVGRRNQSVINELVKRCDVFVLAIHRRWGQKAPDSNYSSYTEEEFHLALDRLRKYGRPEIFVFFKEIDPGQMADPGPQLNKVLLFRKELESSRQVLYRPFADVDGFRKELAHHLRSFANGEVPPRDLPLQPLLLPLELRQQVQEAQKECEMQSARAAESAAYAEEHFARAESLALALAERAAAAAAEGRIEVARQDFAKATDGTSSPEVLKLASSFYLKTGELNALEQLTKRLLSLVGDAHSLERAHVLQRLANLYCDLGAFPQAEQIAHEASRMYKALGEERFVAQQEVGIGLIYLKQGKLSESKAFFDNAINKFIELNLVEDIVTSLGNVAVWAAQAGQLEMAEKLQGNVLACEERLERADGIASASLNLGLINLEQGKLDPADQLIKRAKVISEVENDFDSVIRAYGALAMIEKKRGNHSRKLQIIDAAIAVAKSINRTDMVDFFENWLASEP